MLKPSRKAPAPSCGHWRWDEKLGLLFEPKTEQHANARNETSKLMKKNDTLKIAGKMQYKRNRVANDKVIEGFAKLVTHTEEKKKCVIVDEKRQVELKDIKRGAVQLNKYSLHNKIPETFLRYYDSCNCARGLGSFMKHEDYDKFLMALIHYFYFYLLGLTQKYFRLTIKAGRLFRLPGQIEIPMLKERNRQRKIFHYEIQRARLELAKKYCQLLMSLMNINQPSSGSFTFKPQSVIPERFFVESLLNVSCLGVCVCYLQRSNRLIQAEFGRLFRREAFNMDSLERNIDYTDYECYADRALRVFENSRQRIQERQLAEKLSPRLSPKSHRLRLSDTLAKPSGIDWRSRVANRPKVWKATAKKPFYVLQPSVPDTTDYASQKHRLATEIRKNSPVLGFWFNPEHQELRDRINHTAPNTGGNALLAKLRPKRGAVWRIPRRLLTPFHLTLGILGQQLRLFDYWTMLPAMHSEKKLTLPGLTQQARYRAFKTMRLLFPYRQRRTKINNSGRQQNPRDKIAAVQLEGARKIRNGTKHVKALPKQNLPGL